MNSIEMAWKNIFRNKRRSLLSGSAIFITAIVICLLLSFENAMISDMEKNIKNHTTGDVRVRNAQYTENERLMPLQFYVDDSSALMAHIMALNENASPPLVRLVTPQTPFGASIYRNDTTYRVQGVGLDFETSQFFVSADVTFISGQFPAEGSREVLIAEGLAKSLSLAVSDTFTVFTKTAVGGTNAMTFTVSGIVHIPDADFNGSVFFLDWQRAASFLRMNGNALEVLVFGTDSISENTLATVLSSELEQFYENTASDMQVEVLLWKEVNFLFQLFELTTVFYAYISMILFALSCTVIFNTTMMAVLERKKEIGTLSSLGMSSQKIVGLFLLESIFIALIATISGIALGFIGVSIFGSIGFDLASFGGSSVGGLHFSSYVYPVLGFDQYVLVFVVSIISASVACIFPARMAAKVEPAEALRSEH